MAELILIVLLVAGFGWGFHKGAVRMLGALAGVIVGIVVCRLWSRPAAEALAAMCSDSPAQLWIRWTAVVLMFAAGYVLTVLCARLVDVTFKALALGPFNSLAGGILLALITAVMASFVLNAIVFVAPSAINMNAGLFDGALLRTVIKMAPGLVGWVSDNQLASLAF